MIKRIIFDLDRTLIPWLDEWDSMVEKTYNYFNIPFEKDEFSRFHQVMLDYEKHHKRYDKKEMSKFYQSMIAENEDKLFENDIKLTFKDDMLVLSYDINLKELKNNKNYKKASTFIKNIKASGFTCK